MIPQHMQAYYTPMPTGQYVTGVAAQPVVDASSFVPGSVPNMAYMQAMAAMPNMMRPVIQQNVSAVSAVSGGSAVRFQQAAQAQPAPAQPAAAQNSPVLFFENVPAFQGSDVYVASQGVVVGRDEKRYVRLRYGDGSRGNKARWVGFAPRDWSMRRTLKEDPELLGFYIKPNLCDRGNRKIKEAGWITLSLDCDRRAVKATIDGWTLGKVFIPTWLLGRVMRPVAVSETGTPVTFAFDQETGCDKVIRSGFKKWSTIMNYQLEKLKCQFTHQNFEQQILGMTLACEFDEDSNVVSIGDCDDSYVSYRALKAGYANANVEVLPLVINDRHAYRIKESRKWDLFYSDDKLPLDYLSDRMTALLRKVYEAKMTHNQQVLAAAVTKLSHMRHMLAYFSTQDNQVVKDANNRVQWFLGNDGYSGVHKFFTPDLGRLLICVVVSDFQWEEIAVPFFAEALHRALPVVMAQNPKLKWKGDDCSPMEELLEALLITRGGLAETILQVQILNKLFKPHHPDLDNIELEKLRAEEICCGIAGLSEELHVVAYAKSCRKDEIKKFLMKREWETEAPAETEVPVLRGPLLEVVESAINEKPRFRGMIERYRMLAECHGSGGLPTPEWFAAITEAVELAKSLDNWEELLECFGLDYPGDEETLSIIKHSVLMAEKKGYLSEGEIPGWYASPEGEPTPESNLLSARTTLRLTPTSREKLSSQGTKEIVFEQELLPEPASSEGSSYETDESAGSDPAHPSQSQATSNTPGEFSTPTRPQLTSPPQSTSPPQTYIIANQANPQSYLVQTSAGVYLQQPTAYAYVQPTAQMQPSAQQPSLSQQPHSDPTRVKMRPPPSVEVPIEDLDKQILRPPVLPSRNTTCESTTSTEAGSVILEIPNKTTRRKPERKQTGPYVVEITSPGSSGIPYERDVTFLW